MSGDGRPPDFLLIGAMKSGTTTLYGHLARHPELFLSTPKEPQFFSREAVYARGIDWYRSLFAPASPEQRCGEASACYSRWPHFGDVAGRIARHVPQAKLLYLMRHPVDRAYSHYTHLMEERLLRKSGPVLSFEEAVEEIPEILDASRYLMQIQHYLEHFPREQLLLLTLDDLHAHPERTLAEVTRFLGVGNLGSRRTEARVDNRMGDRMARAQTRDVLARARDLPGVSTLAPILPPSVRSRLRETLMRPGVTRLLNRRALRRHRQGVSPLRPDTRRRLLERLTPETRELEALLGRSLSGWFS